MSATGRRRPDSRSSRRIVDLPLAIRPLAPSDSIAELTDLLHRAYGGLRQQGLHYVASWQDEGTTRLRIAGADCYVAELEGRVVATISFKGAGAARPDGCEWYARPDVASCSQLGVEPQLQGRGIGSALMDLVEEGAWCTGAAEIALDTAEPATALVDWYGRRGYRFVQHADWAATNYRSVVLSKNLSGRTVCIRAGTGEDAALLESLLVESVNWNLTRPRMLRREILARPALRRYAAGWGREGDTAVIAVDEREEPVGAAWYRFFARTEPGFGHVSEDVPELSIAVCLGWRHRGIGQRLLTALEDRAREGRIAALSLSVETENDCAVRLYRRLGYRAVAAHRGAVTMRKDLRP